MTPLQWTLAVCAACILAGLAAVLVYTCWATMTGRKSVSGYLKSAPRWMVALVAFLAGLVCGLCGAHWWWPTSGG